MTKLNTHVLGTAGGVPTAKMSLRLTRLDGPKRECLVVAKTNNDYVPLLGSPYSYSTYTGS